MTNLTSVLDWLRQQSTNENGVRFDFNGLVTQVEELLTATSPAVMQNAADKATDRANTLAQSSTREEIKYGNTLYLNEGIAGAAVHPVSIGAVIDDTYHSTLLKVLASYRRP